MLTLFLAVIFENAALCSNNPTVFVLCFFVTLTCLINEHACLFISEKFETLPVLIAPCPFINFLKFVQPACLLGMPIFQFVPFPLASFIDTMTKSHPII